MAMRSVRGNGLAEDMTETGGAGRSGVLTAWDVSTEVTPK